VIFNQIDINTNIKENDTQTNFTQKSEIQPLYILYSKDNFEDIGDPKVFNDKGADFLTLWEDTYNSLLRNEENNNYIDNDETFILKELKGKYLESRLDEELEIFEYTKINNFFYLY
jgi:hypothetical protein